MSNAAVEMMLNDAINDTSVPEPFDEADYSLISLSLGMAIEIWQKNADDTALQPRLRDQFRRKVNEGNNLLLKIANL